MEQFNSELKFTVGDNPLVIACQYNYIDSVKLLLKQKEFHISNNDFHRAICYSMQNPDMLQILLHSKFYENFNCNIKFKGNVD